MPSVVGPKGPGGDPHLFKGAPVQDLDGGSSVNQNPFDILPPDMCLYNE